MKTFKSLTRMFVIGFFLSFVLLNFTHCPDSSTSPNGNNNTNIGKESDELKQFNAKVETLFVAKNSEELAKVSYENISEELKSDIAKYPEKAGKFGEAFKNRKLIFANEIIAEYELTIDGEKFTITMGNSGDGIWKIMRY